MKDYSRLVLWLDYFNSSLSRSQGRRVPLNKAVKNPSLGELIEAAKRAGYEPEPQVASYPKRYWIPSGYVSIEKKKPKATVIKELALLLRTVRGEKK